MTLAIDYPTGRERDWSWIRGALAWLAIFIAFAYTARVTSDVERQVTITLDVLLERQTVISKHPPPPTSGTISCDCRVVP